MERKLILLSNDDGVQSEGLRVLQDFVRELGRVVVVAPVSERSAASHSITLKKEVRVEEVERDIFAVDGTPVDCVLIAIYGILKRKPDLVISGINRGHNLGEDVFYSGTVAAAREGAMYGIPSIAISLVIDGSERLYYETGGYFAQKIAKFLLDRKLNGELLNVNVPNKPKEEIKGIRITRLSTRMYKDPVLKIRENVFLIGGEPLWNLTRGSDLEAIEEGYISVSPLLIDITDYEKLRVFRKFEKEIG
ncbi:MAG: 5'/3'-nucleotidase SurE [candidate division WOR-3 bacterium]